MEATYNCDEDGLNCGEPNYGFIFLLFLSFFFAHQVIQNSVHVTVAGVVGNWWVAPEENGCCGRAVINSFIRTMTTSFGSICFGVSGCYMFTNGENGCQCLILCSLYIAVSHCGLFAGA